MRGLTSDLQNLIKHKNISFIGGLCLLFNQMTGPGIPFTASNFQSPGWFLTIFCYALFGIISGFSMLFLIESMQAIPGNSHFQGHVEYGTLINFYFGSVAHLFGQFVLYGALQSNAIQSIVLISQTLDSLLVDIAGKTCGVTTAFQWICVSQHGTSSPSPFENTFMIFTIGFLVTLALSAPLGMVGLSDNVAVTLGF